MTELEPVLQWVAISEKLVEDKVTLLHQYEEDGVRNINEMLSLAEDGMLDVLIGIPLGQRIGSEQPVGSPFIGVDMNNGLFNIDGSIWNFMPKDIDPSSVEFRPIWYHSVRKDFASDSMEELDSKITQYKIGWQFTHEDKNYQRIIFYDVKTGIYSIKEKR